MTRPGKFQRRRWLWAALFLTVAVSLPWCYGQARRWRSEQLLTQARGLAGKKDLAGAIGKAQAAYHLNPANLEAGRSIATWSSLTDPATGLTWWERVCAQPEAVWKDRLAYADSAMNNRRLELAGRILAVLEKEQPRVSAVRAGRARWLALQDRLVEAVAVLRPVADWPETDLADQFYYIRLTQNCTDPDVQTEGLEALWRWAGESGPRALAAARALARNPNLKTEERHRLAGCIGRLADSGRDGREDRLLRLEVLQPAMADTLEEWMREAVREFDTAQPEGLLELGRWLNRHRQHAEVLRWISAAQASQRRDLFLVRLDALAFLDRWDEIGRALEGGRPPVEDFLKYFFQMRVALETQRYAQAEIYWERALLACGDEATRLALLAEKAGQLKLPGHQRGALERMMAWPSQRRAAGEELVRLLQQQGETALLLAHYEKMRDFFPDDQTVAGDSLYLKALLDQADEASVSEARHLARRNPQMLANHITLSLCLWKTGQPEAALEVLRAVSVDWSQVRDRWRAVFAAILAANGQDAEARAAARRLRRANLLAEEWRLIEAAGLPADQ